MLDVRTNILFDRETYKMLAAKAKMEKKSIGALIRTAVEKVYKKNNEEEIKRRTEVVKEIMEMRKKMKPLPKNVKIKDLINWGRKYKYP